MKKITTLVLLLTVGLINAQAFQREKVMLNLMLEPTFKTESESRVSSDFGLGENMSARFVTLIYYRFLMI
jgi:hypothetical protein